MNTTPLIRLAVLLAAMAGLLLGLQAPLPADAATREVEVCVLKGDLGKSWTRGLERAANRRFHQRVDVHRVTEGQAENRRCDVTIWRGGRVALDYEAGVPAANPRYDVMVDDYGIMINVGSSTPKHDRRATLLRALAEGGVR